MSQTSALIYLTYLCLCRTTINSHYYWLSEAFFLGQRERECQTGAPSPITWRSSFNCIYSCIPENRCWDEPWGLSTNHTSWLGALSHCYSLVRRHALGLLLQKGNQHIKGIPAAYQGPSTCSITRQPAPSPRGKGSFSMEARKVCVLINMCNHKRDAQPHVHVFHWSAFVSCVTPRLKQGMCPNWVWWQQFISDLGMHMRMRDAYVCCKQMQLDLLSTTYVQTPTKKTNKAWETLALLFVTYPYTLTPGTQQPLVSQPLSTLHTTW